MKTVKQIADELGTDKQKVYRYIKRNHISEAHQKKGMMYYDETAETAIKQAFSQNICISEAHQKHFNDTVNDTIIDMLKNELNIKNKQIDELNARLADITAALVSAQQTAAAAQALHAGTLQGQLTGGNQEPPPTDGRTGDETNKKNGFMSRFFRKEK